MIRLFIFISLFGLLNSLTAIAEPECGPYSDDPLNQCPQGAACVSGHCRGNLPPGVCMNSSLNCGLGQKCIKQKKEAKGFCVKTPNECHHDRDCINHAVCDFTTFRCVHQVCRPLADVLDSVACLDASGNLSPHCRVLQKSQFKIEETCEMYDGKSGDAYRCTNYVVCRKEDYTSESNSGAGKTQLGKVSQ